MDFILDFTKAVVCSVFLISIFALIGLLIVINKKKRKGRMFSVESQDWQ
jgi:hypothetical protein